MVETGARLIHLTPSCYDELRGKSIGYAKVLDRYSDWLLSLRKSAKWEVIDIHYPMQNYQEAHRKIDSKFKVDGFALAADGVHPDDAGHWIIAKQILLYLDCKEVKNSSGMADNLASVNYGAQIFKLVSERQNMMRDAWLTATGHKRPGLPIGLPLKDAQVISDALEQEISILLQNKKIT
ncbi:MAG: family lipolytic protein [Mucilaginibacter sp.]|nr:family lipolytic protein [Mucilaginibacter sp.]